MTKKKSKQNKPYETNELEKTDFLNKKICFSKKRNFSPAIKKDIPVKKIKYPKFTCPKCGKQITEIAAALSDKETGEPAHFSCVLEILKNSETLKENEEIIYIGSGNFAIVAFENPKNRKKFTITKLIEWENKAIISSWKNEIADLASKV